MPCPVCNVPEEGERPAMPADFTPHYDVDKGPMHRRCKQAIARYLARHVNVARRFFDLRFVPLLPQA